MTHITLTSPTYLQKDETYIDEKDLFQSLYLKMFGSQHIHDVDFRSHDDQDLPAELVAKGEESLKKPYSAFYNLS